MERGGKNTVPRAEIYRKRPFPPGLSTKFPEPVLYGTHALRTRFQDGLCFGLPIVFIHKSATGNAARTWHRKGKVGASWRQGREARIASARAAAILVGKPLIVMRRSGGVHPESQRRLPPQQLREA